MQITITTIIFGLPTGRRTVQTSVTLPAQAVSVRDLIVAKVRQEIAEYTARQRPGLSGEYLTPEVLIRAATPEALLPGDVHREVCRAQHAYAAREFMIVVDEQRLFDPDEIVRLRPTSRIEFIKILPLVGG